MKVVLDHNLSPEMARALSQLFHPQHQVVSLREKFEPNTPDAQWIEALSREGGWIVLSADRRITRNKAEFEAFRRSGLIGFFLSRGLYKAKVQKQMERILALWDEIEKCANNARGGAMFELQMKSNLVKPLKR
jgi:hypothetical protein